jgi:hypothetical protein
MEAADCALGKGWVRGTGSRHINEFQPTQSDRDQLHPDLLAVWGRKEGGETRIPLFPFSTFI